MTPQIAPARASPSRDSAIMLAALGILAYAASMMTHEAVGHGVYCVAAGGHNTMLTVWEETCRFPGVPPLGIKAAGPGVQFGAGFASWVVLRLLFPNAAGLRYFFWLFMVFGLLVSSGYVAFSGVTNIGDAAEIVVGRHTFALWRGGLIVLGAGIYFLSMRAAAFELKRFAGGDDASGRLFRLVWIPYVAAGVFACLTGALNRTIKPGAALGMAAASSFGAGLGMLFLPFMRRDIAAKESSPTVYVGLRTAWVIVAVAVIGVFLFFIGPGLE